MFFPFPADHPQEKEQGAPAACYSLSGHIARCVGVVVPGSRISGMTGTQGSQYGSFPKDGTPIQILPKIL